MSTESIKSPSLQRMQELLAANLDPEVTKALLDKVEAFAELVTNQKISEVLGEEHYRQLSEVSDLDQRQAAIAQAYLEKTGQTTTELHAEMLEKTVQDFEKS